MYPFESGRGPSPEIACEQRPPRIWKFWGTAVWGLFIFAALFVGQIVVVAWFVLRRGGPIDIAATIHVVGGGLTILLSLIMGVPARLSALWVPRPPARALLSACLALRPASRRDFLCGTLGL